MALEVGKDTSNDWVSTNVPISAYPFTFSCWYYYPSIPGSTKCIFSFCDSGAANKINSVYTNSNDIYEYINSTGGGSTPNQIGTGWWHFALVARSTTDRSFFLDGTRYNHTTNLSLGTGSNNWTIGHFCDSTPSGHMGAGYYAAESGIWDVDLEDDEVEALAGGLAPIGVRPGDLLRYWPMEHQETSSFRDKVSTDSAAITGTLSHPITSHPMIHFPQPCFEIQEIEAAAADSSALFMGCNF